jgi:ATP phosphoribosyltransferase
LDQKIRIALPKGRLLNKTAVLADAAGWKLSDYSEGARLYHLTSAGFSNLSGKILHEKDIPVQVAMGNYDLGICGLDWIEEQVSKYPASALVKLRDLGYGSLELFLAASRAGGFSSLEAINSSEKVIGIASEYPNLAESLALNCRCKRFNVYPLWGAAEIYPPENSDLVLLSCQPGQKLFEGDLFPVRRVLESSAYLIANKVSLETKDLSRVLESLYINMSCVSEPKAGETICRAGEASVSVMKPDSVRLALPDGHAQKHVVNILSKTGVRIKDYPSAGGNRRPEIEIPGVTVKVN